MHTRGTSGCMSATRLNKASKWGTALGREPACRFAISLRPSCSQGCSLHYAPLGLVRGFASASDGSPSWESPRRCAPRAARGAARVASASPTATPFYAHVPLNLTSRRLFGSCRVANSSMLSTWRLSDLAPGSVRYCRTHATAGAAGSFSSSRRRSRAHGQFVPLGVGPRHHLPHLPLSSANLSSRRVVLRSRGRVLEYEA